MDHDRLGIVRQICNQNSMRISDAQFIFNWVSVERSPKGKSSITPWKQDTGALFVRMRSIAIWEAQEMMERWVSERDDPSPFLAYGPRRREAA
jgi:hypothetical protein